MFHCARKWLLFAGLASCQGRDLHIMTPRRIVSQKISSPCFLFFDLSRVPPRGIRVFHNLYVRFYASAGLEPITAETTSETPLEDRKVYDTSGLTCRPTFGWEGMRRSSDVPESVVRTSLGQR
ncbi:hypothetical protein EDB92DRAFT_1876972 [Lactarius akahatsu]|uniref:Secreted protein n=1 Tax=Lactarius akahatsu TaxID=416441 RepID=A0AAD4QBI6_9AGAM|nr:hypothetical protein EDB92DRAFT_1876972 [Lactarius akahatsu]